jgi:MerR family copper efflux transcriptional regulator
MRIGELSHRTGLTVKTIRFYESAGVLPEPDRLDSGYRDYGAEGGGRRAVRDSDQSPCQHVADLLDAHERELDRRLRELRALRAQVRRLRERARTLDPAQCRPEAVCQVIPSGR